MNGRDMISGRQFTLIIAIITSQLSIFEMPEIILGFSKQYAWVSMCMAVSGDVLVAGVLFALGRKYPGRTLFEYPQLILGRFTGKLFALCFAQFFLYTGAVALLQIRQAAPA